MDTTNDEQLEAAAIKFKNYHTLARCEEQHSASVSANQKFTKKETKRVKKLSKTSIKTTTNRIQETCSETTESEYIVQLGIQDKGNINGDVTKSSNDEKSNVNNEKLENVAKKKSKSKKNKKNGNVEENISVKSSFSKFDALEKKSLLQNLQEIEVNCRLCSKPVYKMEEVKAEKFIFHKACFRCNECGKLLKVDNYKSHEGVQYCAIHFKLLFAPKCSENVEPEILRKPELIIRENEPTELPPDVARASDKPNLGLEELQQLNVRSRFQVFEKCNNNGNENEKLKSIYNNVKVGVQRTGSILSKLAKLEKHGFNTGDILPRISLRNSLDNDKEEGSSESSDTEVKNSSIDAEKENIFDVDEIKLESMNRECPIGITESTMNDIKLKFEKGLMTKEERREVCKQEIQNIRSRLFLGKQAKIKEMYRQAVVDSEQGITSIGKVSDIDFGHQATDLKARFENGEIYKSIDNEVKGSNSIHDDVEVFECAISKNSRNIFKNLEESNRQNNSNYFSKPSKKCESEKENFESNKLLGIQQEITNVVKYNEELEDVKVKTSEISEKFKFFETYQPKDSTRKEFRITPPREGVVKMPINDDDNRSNQLDCQNIDINILEKSLTTSKMLNKFRELEEKKESASVGLRPLKRFTPPLDAGQRLYGKYDESDCSPEDDYDDEEDDYDGNKETNFTDEGLAEAKAAARAKILRAKFEKWEVDEIQREKDEGLLPIYSNNAIDDTIETTKNIRERFENMKNFENSSTTKPRCQVNRFI